MLLLDIMSSSCYNKLHALTNYYSGSFSVLAKELEGCFYLTQIFPEPFALNIRTIATLFQHLSEIFSWNQSVNNTSPISSYIQYFKLVFAKEDFDTFLDYCKWNNTIKLIPGAKLKLSKIYSLFLLYPKLQNMSETCLTSIQHQIPTVIWPYLCLKLYW